MRNACALIGILLSARAAAAPAPKKLPPPRLGVPIILQHEFRTNVVAICVGKVRALAAIQGLHAAVGSDHPEAIHVDDRDPKHPTYFFDVALHDVQVEVNGEAYRLVLTLFASHGLQNPILQDLSTRGHEFLIVAASPREAAAGVEALKKQLPEQTWPRIHPYIVGAGETDASALRRITDDVVNATRRAPGRPDPSR